MAIEWNSTIDNPPIPGKEIIAKNPLKPTNDYISAKQCRVMKPHHNKSQEKIVEDMMDDNFSLWSYTA